MNLILRQTSLLIGALSVDGPDIEANQSFDRIPNNGPRTGRGALNDRFVYVQCTNI